MILFADSFSHYAFGNGVSGNGIAQKYAITSTGFLGAGMVGGRYGGQALNVFNTGFGEYRLTRQLPGPRNLLRVHFNYMPVNGYQASGFFQFNRGGPLSTLLTMFENNPAGTVTIYTGGNGTNGNRGVPLLTTPAFPINQWYTLEIEALFTTPGYVRVYSNDVLIASASSIAWPSALVPDRFCIKWEALGSVGFRMCDLVVSDDQGTYNTTRLGPSRVVAIFPTRDAIPPHWTRNTGSNDASCINDPLNDPSGCPDGDATYIQANAILALDLFGVDAPACFGLDLGVALTATAKNGLTGADQVGLMCRPDPTVTTDVQISSETLTSSYAMYQAVQESSLRSGGPNWTDLEIGNAYWGVKQVFGEPRVTQFVLEKITSLRVVPFNCGSGSYSF